MKTTKLLLSVILIITMFSFSLNAFADIQIPKKINYYFKMALVEDCTYQFTAYSDGVIETKYINTGEPETTCVTDNDMKIVDKLVERISAGRPYDPAIDDYYRPDADGAEVWVMINGILYFSRPTFSYEDEPHIQGANKDILELMHIVLRTSQVPVDKLNLPENWHNTKGSLYVNGVETKSDSTVLFRFYNTSVLFPLRTIFEALGAEVAWQPESGNIVINYSGKRYLCETITSTVITVKDITNEEDGSYIQLDAEGIEGGYYNFDGRVYLFRHTGVNLLETLGIDVEIDTNQLTLKITSIRE